MGKTVVRQFQIALWAKGFQGNVRLNNDELQWKVVYERWDEYEMRSALLKPSQ